MTSPTAPMSRSRLIPMQPRDPNEPGRTATTLELFFDLVFVVAVSIAASSSTTHSPRPMSLTA